MVGTRDQAVEHLESRHVGQVQLKQNAIDCFRLANSESGCSGFGFEDGNGGASQRIDAQHKALYRLYSDRPEEC